MPDTLTERISAPADVEALVERLREEAEAQDGRAHPKDIELWRQAADTLLRLREYAVAARSSLAEIAFFAGSYDGGRYLGDMGERFCESLDRKFAELAIKSTAVDD